MSHLGGGCGFPTFYFRENIRYQRNRSRRMLCPAVDDRNQITRSVGANLEKILDVHFSLLADAGELEYSVEVQLTERTQVEVTLNISHQ